MKITVTQRDIERGSKFHCTRCPVARAIRRKLNCRLEVFCTYGLLFNPKQYFKIPSIASIFIKDFDNEKPVRPFSFELKVK